VAAKLVEGGAQIKVTENHCYDSSQKKDYQAEPFLGAFGFVVAGLRQAPVDAIGQICHVGFPPGEIWETIPNAGLIEKLTSSVVGDSSPQHGNELPTTSDAPTPLLQTGRRTPASGAWRCKN
jgi:hypothetical protein